MIILCENGSSVPLTASQHDPDKRGHDYHQNQATQRDDEAQWNPGTYYI